MTSTVAYSVAAKPLSPTEDLKTILSAIPVAKRRLLESPIIRIAVAAGISHCDCLQLMEVASIKKSSPGRPKNKYSCGWGYMPIAKSDRFTATIMEIAELTGRSEINIKNRVAKRAKMAGTGEPYTQFLVPGEDGTEESGTQFIVFTTPVTELSE